MLDCMRHSRSCSRRRRWKALSVPIAENEIDTGKSSEFAEPLRRFFQGSIPEGVKLDFSTDYCVDMPPKVWTAVE